VEEGRKTVNADNPQTRNVLTTFIITLAAFLAMSWASGCVVGPDDGSIIQPAGDLRVLVLHESSANTTREQMAVIYGAKFRKWFDDNSVEMRVFDPDVTFPDDSDSEWKEFTELGKSASLIQDVKLPALIIFHGAAAKAYPVPDSEAEAVKFLDQQKG
jgi:hypothetical protein